MRRKKRLQAAAGVLLWGALAVFCSGCAAYREQAIAPITSWPPPPPPQLRTLRVDLTVYSVVNGEPEWVASESLDRFKKLAVNAYQQSGQFSVVTSAQADADLVAYIQMKTQMSVNWPWLVLSGVTLTIIPSTFKEEVIITTTLRDRTGALLGKVDKSDTLYVWQQFALLFVMPWYYPDTVLEQMIYDLHRSTILECRQGRLWSEPVAAVQQDAGAQGTSATPE